MTVCPTKTSFLLAVLLCRLPAAAQVFSNDAAVREANFVTRVVELDEFIHRFNNDSNSEIRRYYISHHRSWDKSRDQLIRSLFNYGGQTWEKSRMDQFIKSVIDPRQPDSLSFMGGQWYAEADCEFWYHEALVKVDLILKIQVNADSSAQWVIAAVKPGFTFSAESNASDQGKPHSPSKTQVRNTPLPKLIPISNVAPKKRFIQPAANETYFAELERDFADKRRLKELFDKGFFQRRYSLPFYQAVLNDRIRFLAVKKLRYHFLQVRDWVFTVENFDRATRNSGWLIASIRKVNPQERAVYVKNLLEE